MASVPRIRKVEVDAFTWDVKGMRYGPKAHYDPDSTWTRTGGAIRIHADNGVVGEYAGFWVDPRVVAESAKGLVGKEVTAREQIYQELKLSPARGPIDVALWDWAGKTVGLPIHALLGTYRTKVPGYASTIDGAVKGPLSTPESYGDFAQQCLEMGYRGFKIHPFAWPEVRTHMKAVEEIGKSVGGKMDMMLDSFCWYQTFADAVKVGRACDEAGFFWYEDPYSDGGITPFSHAKLREMIRTPLLQGEKLRSLEERMAFVLAGATDFVRGEVETEGITGTVKMAHAVESLGLDIEPHIAGPAQLHFLAATKNANYFEVVWVHPNVRDFGPPIYTNVNITRLDCIDQDGMVQVPDGPGLGVDFDWDYINAHSIAHVVES